MIKCVNKVLTTVAGAATVHQPSLSSPSFMPTLGNHTPPLSRRLVVMKIVFLTNSQVPQLENTEEEAQKLSLF